MAETEWFDGLRWIVLAQGAILFGFAIAIMLEARKFRAPPRHVWAIAVSYAVLIAGYMTEVAVRLGDQHTWRTYLAFVSFSFGFYAMWLMWRAYNYAARLERHEKQTIQAANKLMSEAFDHSTKR